MFFGYIDLTHHPFRRFVVVIEEEHIEPVRSPINHIGTCAFKAVNLTDCAIVCQFLRFDKARTKRR